MADEADTESFGPGFRPWQILQRLEALEDNQRQLGHIQQRMQREISVAQSDIDALTAALSDSDAELGTAVGNLGTAVTAIQTEIAALEAAQPELDLTGLTAAVTAAQDQASAVSAAVATAAALVPPATG
jgi:predicted  nucleic acid-binding Zn-ribbon protein